MWTGKRARTGYAIWQPAKMLWPGKQRVSEVAQVSASEKKHVRQRHDNGPVPAKDTPADRYNVCAHDDHRGATGEADNQREPETLEDLGHFEPEVRTLDLLLCCAPGDVVREEVGEERLREMNAESAEEEEAVNANCERDGALRVSGRRTRRVSK